MNEERLTFATEEEKLTAIEGFDISTEDESKLDELMNAEVVPATTDETPIEPVVETETPGETPVEPDPTTEEPKTEDSQTDITGSQSTEKTMIEQLEAKIEEQNRFIQENLMNQGNYHKLQEEIAELKQNKEVPPEEKKPEIKESKLSELVEARKNLLLKYPNPEDRLDAEYITEMNRIDEGLFDELGGINHNMSIYRTQAEEAKKKVDEYYVTRESEAQRNRQQNAQEKQQEEIEAFAAKNPEFKLSKSFGEVNRDYSAYQLSVAKVYWGQDVQPNELDKINEAMNSLQNNSPNLKLRLQAAQIPVEPNEDMKRYLGLCELWDHWQGYRKDSRTGDYQRDKKGQAVPVTRWEPSQGQYVPDTFPTVEAAYNDQSVKSGYWMSKVIQAKIDGGKEALQAANKKGDTAVELGSGGTGQQSATEIAQNLNNMNVDYIMTEFWNGNRKPFDDFNAKAKLIGMEPLEDPQSY